MCFSNSTELNNLLNKTLTYQNNPVLGEFTTVNLGGEQMDETPFMPVLTWIILLALVILMDIPLMVSRAIIRLIVIMQAIPQHGMPIHTDNLSMKAAHTTITWVMPLPVMLQDGKHIRLMTVSSAHLTVLNTIIHSSTHKDVNVAISRTTTVS